MRILGIETSCDHSGVALVEDGRAIAERSFPSRMSLSETLPGHIQAVLGERAFEELDAIAVSLGPGSFTGLRIGVAMAKAIAHATGIPLVGIPTHEALVSRLTTSDAQRVCVLQHARRADGYVTIFERDRRKAELLPTGPCVVTPVTELLARLEGNGEPVTFIGDGVDRHKEAIASALGDLAKFANPAGDCSVAVAVATLGARRLPDADPNAALNLRPIYVLASQAERQQGVDLGLK